LLEPSGGWSERSAATATVEFLELVRARLGEGGLACLWIPDSALTREGFLVLLATWARVFPRVEAWAGQGGDVLLLANKDDAPHDFQRMLDAYHDPHVAAACQAAWIATPETMLSQFLIDDATVRRLSSGRTPSTRLNGALAREEAGRRRAAPTVDPVPGLAAIRDDVVATLVNTPGEGFAPAIAIAIRARDLEWKGLDFELDGNLEDATAAYREAISLNPHDGAVRRAFATLRSQQGIGYGNRQAFFVAHSYMREAVETDTSYAQGFGNLGLLLAQAEQFDYAIACTGQGIELAPDDDLLQLQMGRIWKQRGYYDKALPYYEKAMELNPKSVEAGIGFVDAKLAMEGDAADLRWGVDFLEKYRALEPQHEDLLYRIGKLNDALSRHAKREAADSSAAPLAPAAPPSPSDSATTASGPG
jgi:tetratricopeptide (TPR) repeat protein